MITTLINADNVEYEKLAQADERWMHFYMKYPKLYWLREMYWERPIWYLLCLVCKYKGHDLVDEGYAGPESGAIDMRCVRCNQNWHTQLY